MPSTAKLLLRRYSLVTGWALRWWLETRGRELPVLCWRCRMATPRQEGWAWACQGSNASWTNFILPQMRMLEPLSRSRNGSDDDPGNRMGSRQCGNARAVPIGRPVRRASLSERGHGGGDRWNRAWAGGSQGCRPRGDYTGQTCPGIYDWNHQLLSRPATRDSWRRLESRGD